MNNSSQTNNISQKRSLIYKLIFQNLFVDKWVLFTSRCFDIYLKLKRVNPIIRYSEKLLQNNDLEGGVSFLLLICKINLIGRNYAKNKLYRIAIWYARAGHLKKGEAIIQSISSEKIKRDLLVRYWNKFSCFDNGTLKTINEYLEFGVSVSAAQSALKSLWLTSEDNDLLSEHYLKYLNIANYSKHRVFIQECLSALKVLGKDDLIRAYLRANLECVPCCENVLALADGSLSDIIDSNVSCSTLNSTIRESQKEIYSKLSDTATSIAVVGNSPCEMGLNKGREIDSHDIVIRFNKFSVSGRFVSDYGSNTSIIVVTKSIVNKLSSYYQKNAELLITGEDPLIYPPEFGYNSDALVLFKNVSFVDQSVYKALTNKLSASPSSGLQVLQLIHSLRGGFINVNLYGFGLHNQVGDDPESSGYIRKTKPSFRHNWLGEANYLRTLINNTKHDIDTYHSLRYRNSMGKVSEFKPLKVKMLGNHSKYHCGSGAVIQYLTKHIQNQGVLVKDDSYDLLVVNGEGSMHHDSKAHIKKMEALKEAVELGRRAMLINTVWQENSHAYDHTLQKLDLVSAREELSCKELLLHNVNSSRSLDFSYWAPIGWAKGYNYDNKIVVTDFYSKEFKTFVILNGGVESKFDYVDMKSINWTTLVKSLKTASMLITGRHHAVYAACKAEIPFIAFKGNTHKIEGLIESSGIPIRLCDDRGDIPELIEWVNSNRHLYKELYSWMKKQPKFTIPFELL